MSEFVKEDQKQLDERSAVGMFNHRPDLWKRAREEQCTMKKLWNEEVLLVVLMDIKFHSFSASLEEFILSKKKIL